MTMHTHVTYVVIQNGGNMKNKKIPDDYMKNLLNDPERLKKFMREVMGPPTKELIGKEKSEVMLILALLEPYNQSNNQHAWTDSYKVGNIKYDVTYWPDSGDPTIVEYLPEEN